MDDASRDAFLDRPLIGSLGLVGSDGRPIVLPIWYRWTGNAILVWSDPAFPWVRRLAESPAVASTVYEPEPPYGAVYARGTATVQRGPIASLRDEIRSIVARYIDGGAVERSIDGFDRGGEKVIVTIRPTTIRGTYNTP